MEKNHPQVKFGKNGILLVNLGTPDSTSWWDIRKYLKEFLSDRRVIEVNPFLWQIILNLVILNLRPSKTATAYKEIWMKETNESPLRYYTKQQTIKLKQKLDEKNNMVIQVSNQNLVNYKLKVVKILFFSRSTRNMLLQQLLQFVTRFIDA